jgi:hypothetical protein
MVNPARDGTYEVYVGEGYGVYLRRGFPLPSHALARVLADEYETSQPPQGAR